MVCTCRCSRSVCTLSCRASACLCASRAVSTCPMRKPTYACVQCARVKCGSEATAVLRASMAPLRQRRARSMPCSYAVSASDDEVDTANPSLSLKAIPFSFPLLECCLAARRHCYVTHLPRQSKRLSLVCLVSVHCCGETVNRSAHAWIDFL